MALPRLILIVYFLQALVNNLLVRMYHQGLEISVAQYARFKEVAQLAATKKQSLLILPCHKSHIASPRGPHDPSNLQEADLCDSP